MLKYVNCPTLRSVVCSGYPQRRRLPRHPSAHSCPGNPGPSHPLGCFPAPPPPVFRAGDHLRAPDHSRGRLQWVLPGHPADDCRHHPNPTERDTHPSCQWSKSHQDSRECHVIRHLVKRGLPRGQGEHQDYVCRLPKSHQEGGGLWKL